MKKNSKFIIVLNDTGSRPQKKIFLSCTPPTPPTRYLDTECAKRVQREGRGNGFSTYRAEKGSYL